MIAPTITFLERMAGRFNIDGSCWKWQAGTNGGGYGQITIPKDMFIPARKESHTMKAATILYEVVNNIEVPKGYHLDHLCRNILCINPKHLEIVTPAINAFRGISMVAINHAKTHCIHGHEFTHENTRLYARKKSGKYRRLCKECMRQTLRKYRALKSLPDMPEPKKAPRQ